MQRLVLLAVLALSGCWPYISEPWDVDYLPEDVQLIGLISYDDFQGDYWAEDPMNGGLAWWGWLDEPTTAYTAVDIIMAQEGCTQVMPNNDVIIDLMADLGGPEQAVLEAPDIELELDWSASENVYIEGFLKNRWAAGATYALPPLQTGAADELESVQLFSTPPKLDLQSPYDFDQAQFPTGRAKDLVFSWDPAKGDADDWFVLEAQALDADQNLLEIVRCTVPFSRGEVAMDTGEFTTSPNFFALVYGPAFVTRARIQDRDVSSSTVVFHRHIGFMQKG